MSQIILLDSTPLGLISNPRSSPENDSCNQWVQRQLQAGVAIAISEIADYEVRRELLRAGKQRGIAKLNSLKNTFDYLPLNTATILRAAEFWAQARQMGRPTAHDLKLDADCIIAAQADLLGADGHTVTVATSNVAHLALFVPAAHWQDIS
jgi:predicted nucleic acid-binding protein